jgi:hypothetical protein
MKSIFKILTTQFFRINSIKLHIFLLRLMIMYILRYIGYTSSVEKDNSENISEK